MQMSRKEVLQKMFQTSGRILRRQIMEKLILEKNFYGHINVISIVLNRMTLIICVNRLFACKGRILYGILILYKTFYAQNNNKTNHWCKENAWLSLIKNL